MTANPTKTIRIVREPATETPEPKLLRVRREPATGPTENVVRLRVVKEGPTA